MRRIERTTRFKKDFRRESKGRYRSSLDQDLIDVVSRLITDAPLAVKYRDHALAGEWKDHRDCHIKPDLLLIYRLIGEDILQLVRLGSHSELSL